MLLMKGKEVVDRKGEKTAFSDAKLREYVQSLMFGLNAEFVKTDEIVDKVILGLPDLISIDELIDLTSETVASLVTVHPDHSLLASRICSKYLQSCCARSFSESIELLKNRNFSNFRRTKPLVSEMLYNTVMENREILDSAIDHSRDFDLTYLGLKTLQKSYLLKYEGNILETPQYLFMRVSLGIHGNEVNSALETYELMSKRYMIHATPTLFNAGTERPYLSSCFLLATDDDSIDGIFKTLHKAALISKAAGGLGLHISNVRSEGAYISGSNGESNGIVPMLRVFNNAARYVDQGGNKRPGAFAIYIEPWHADIFEFLQLKKNHGKEERRARDLFYALWIPDLFMEKVRNDEDWCLFSPDECPGLNDCYGEEFVKLYSRYEEEGRFLEKVRAQKLWSSILESQIETGTPFMLYKDACNQKSNQKNLGTIKSSNLCCEIVEYSSPDETAVCNLGSVCTPMFVEDGIFNFKKLHRVTKVLVRNLDKTIDVGIYPLKEAQASNKRNRPLAVGVLGLADTFMALKIPFDSDEAKKLNIQIFETLYHAALEASVELAKAHGPYSSFEGSPASSSQLQFDLWDVKPSAMYDDWEKLKTNIAKHGLRNSLLVAPMPTASTSQILGFSEGIEPVASNVYSRRTLSGEYQMVNKYLVEDLIKLNMWNRKTKNQIINDNGSVQNIHGLSANIKATYKTVWEISQRTIIDLAADRGPFIDQSQSMSLFLKEPTKSKLNAMHFYAWGRGLKTGMYYLRSQSASSAIKFTTEEQMISSKKRKMFKELLTPKSPDSSDTDPSVCYFENDCDACSG
ncbi:unnamed protein product [Kuraishia capsulata CBS 1993]|uniref:Ribonucleoside-diphosphate reductase n=1 Tax=Kuraishia capsulata CBS 1993 TaxID=1382522 RepID=W6MVG7_9ASCO|nr:uncharacterized protein KUCA_T00005941001 [Kuraishia capsulata CBS 1993]CDK29947.1 unnamed protein product [Kuraishia capsulata CBS 1993]